ncbi:MULTISPECIES: hemerythrin domain-containing protein [Rhodopseudomonas]|uniref:Hemerythrin HHE cation binding domain protein n=1 Tax=Rhodopseudomonas palustris (strain DX-1) TaxID=652103 RepID=E6VC69_RHOPX|nr:MULTISPECIES: hemerythrin domain-containing protein [Rhodopseudomonas]NEW87268.1 hemerythrin domain-containing protein [Rhodopseudomonas sp. WA056]QDL96941.1 hemerythrin domain-containing protein [Rhodopseudomonas palustris]
MFANRISQTLHDEHRATIALMERLEAAISRRQPISVADPAGARLLADLSAAIEADTLRHFDFEETQLFTMFDSVGDQLIGDHLTEEHNFMRPLGEKLIAQARRAQANGFDADSWREFSRAGAELVQRMVVHVQKEEMALLPLLDQTMDDATEARLYDAYVRASQGAEAS